MTMLIRSRHGKRIQTLLKFSFCAIVAVFYFLFLFRESINAFEQNKYRASAAVDQKPKHKHLYKHVKVPNNSNNINITTTSKKHLVKPPSTLNPIYDYSEEIHSATEYELMERRNHLHNVCQHYKLQSLYPPNPREFFISSGHNLVWCNVFKAASTTWMYYFNILGGYDLKFLQFTETQPLELARKRFPRPDLNELLDSLSSSLSFLFVRDPFERVISAYRNKLEGGRNKYYKALGHKIVQKYRIGNTTRQKPRCGPSFLEFLRYIIAQNTMEKPFDEHWVPVFSFCTPCSINFTIIGKLETFQRDSEFIIRQAGLESILLGKLPHRKLRKIGNLSKGIKTFELAERYFSEVNRETLDQLLNIYRMDFELFGYNYTKYYEMIQPDLPNSATTNLTTTAIAAGAAPATAAAAALQKTITFNTTTTAMPIIL